MRSATATGDPTENPDAGRTQTPDNQFLANDPNGAGILVARAFATDVVVGRRMRLVRVLGYGMIIAFFLTLFGLGLAAGVGEG